jgi:hypothetical protein
VTATAAASVAIAAIMAATATAAATAASATEGPPPRPAKFQPSDLGQRSVDLFRLVVGLPLPFKARFQLIRIRLERNDPRVACIGERNTPKCMSMGMHFGYPGCLPPAPC